MHAQQNSHLYCLQFSYMMYDGIWYLPKSFAKHDMEIYLG